MADIRAFRAHRYDLGRVGALSDVVCPPYDVIDARLQQQLYDRSPHNFIRLELNQPQPGDNDLNNRYTRAAGFLRDWLAEGIVKQDSARGLYVYHQEFEVEGRRYVRKGFFARVRLEPFGAGKIFAHEETMAGPKEDRLKLLRATAMNLSPIFGLYPDETNAIQTALDAAVGRSLPFEATDHLDVVSRLWPVTDQQTISAVTGLMGPKPIFIADGHHRYETGLKYAAERGESGDAPANFILMNLVGMSEPGLLILPTHRLVSGLPGLTAAKLASVLSGQFDLEQVGAGNDAARETWERIQLDGTQNALGFGTIADGSWQIGRLRDSSLMDQLAKEHSSDWRSLAVSVLQVLVLNKLVAEGLDKKMVCGYVHLLKEVQEAGSSRQCDLAVLVPSATMAHVERIAGNLEKMPPKSTYFYPKLMSGLVFNSLKTS
jgi:uncharacterized protein (DUF1015 family)